ncbi:MAG TPA: DUF1592 domain-containing protein [Polyangiaceae bacterium]
MIAAASVAACTSSEPPAESTATVTDWACSDSSISESPTRRLTRFEYANIVSDVFGLGELSVELLLPRDEVALGFDNQGGALSLTDFHVDAYFKAAERVAEAALEEPEHLYQLAGCSESSRECAALALTALANRLLRRSPSKRESNKLLALFGDDFSDAGFEEGLHRVIAVLLQSPGFLYRFERATAGDDVEDDADSGAGNGEGLALAPEALASRLSFLYWGSAPDTQLFEAIERGELSTRADLEREAWRMLNDERAERGVLHFFEQWLELTDFDQVEKDRRLYTSWDEVVREQLASETRLFLRAALWEDDGRLETLLGGRYTYATPRLMDFYGLPIVSQDSNEFVRVDFARNEPRFGLLTQGSLLSRLAKVDQTSPIHRGKFVRERFFCTSPEPPPPDIVVSAPTLDPRKTTRERFAEHRANPVCASCHELLDPVGLAFEHYDAVGRYRETEAGAPIDASGYLVDTDVDGPVDGLPGLVSRLTSSSEVRRCMVTQVFRYAFGRGETEQDSCTLDKLEQQFAASDGGFRELLVAVTQTDPFTTPAPVPAAEDMKP